MMARLFLSNFVSCVLTAIFLLLGVMNFILVHPVPGIFYILFACIFTPPFNTLLNHKTGWVIPLWIKIILGLVILWGTLAVGDLAEIYGL
ncbi:hypothetical protein APR41_14115 [Salegentibacter salinarum]|uniref:Uncharacterized protein n=1 Tax=Salegentibacter salinarum TaxID=447422 RepID=A0A2N0U0J9_9FLAO|nr:hypothetical protein [Salegentibacter salinarum]PKD20408.1 hypothetical protein APR41_14115 [Salegentibacter salinarum]SKB85104.1 hypothetical protein SAMN05660903_02868 [Salegentibacter salinarum]